MRACWTPSCPECVRKELVSPIFLGDSLKPGGNCGGRTDKQTDRLAVIQPPLSTPAATSANNKQWTMDLQLAVIVNRCMEAHPLPRGPRWIPLNPYPGSLNVAFLLTPQTLATFPLSPRYVPKARIPMPRSRPMGRGQRPALARSQSRGGPPQPPRQSPPGRSSSQLLMAIAVAIAP